MPARAPTWDDGWAVGLRVWVERAGRAVLGKGRLELLEAIDRCHSISAAARQMGMSYRHAWLLVQAINEGAGQPLVEAATGGAHGGGARLTPLGLRAVSVFRELQGHLEQTAANLLPRLVEGHPQPGLHVAAAVSLEEVLGQLLNDYALRQPTVRVRVVFGASDELAGQLLAGAPADLFLSADPRQLDRLEAARLVQPGASATLAENSLAAVAPTGREVPVRKVRELAASPNLRVALAGPDCPLGGYTRAYLEGLRLYDRLAERAILVENSRAVVTAVRAGQADVGLVYASDAARADGCRPLFRVRRLPVPIRYAGAVVNRGRDPGPARSLLDFLGSTPAAARFRGCGFLPVKSTARPA